MFSNRAGDRRGWVESKGLEGTERKCSGGSGVGRVARTGEEGTWVEGAGDGGREETTEVVTPVRASGNEYHATTVGGTAVSLLRT